MRLDSGINLNILNTNKFKTVQIIIRFETKIEEEIFAKRALLTCLFERNNKDYPDNKRFEEKLDTLYGAKFSATVEKKGELHCLSLNLKLINGRFVNEPNLVNEGIKFLKSVLFAPNIDENHFNETTFELEKKNLIQFVESSIEDNAYYAKQQLKKTFFKQARHYLSSYGNKELIEREDAVSVYHYYQTMLKEDQVEILVCGEVDDQKIIAAFSKFPFKKGRSTQAFETVDEGKQNIITEKVESKKASQSILNLGYYVPVDIISHDYFALQAFNGLFGGFAHSKLFQNIREKQGLAYYADSSIDIMQHFLFVEAGIEQQNRNLALKLINQQLREIQLGHFSDQELLQTSLLLKNIYQQGLDSQRALIERLYLSLKMPNLLPNDQWLEAFAKVSKEDVIRIARQVELQAVYFLEGTAD
ncbi:MULTISPECIES: pitrilysin family protein [unclassified Enterococcus]|uniref:EF-P 5-aminopentanol modification-associated protein YfmF n=1 Tax=unclassified Enterococcus TaxID=2608891 RepID=UPI00155513B3|nr:MULTISPECIES: pitrilysin family protein [unclassified Enterococcus]MBS7577891.1 insulinase family protein [Enterococcus sp. MMGLQ5-2]MBS7585248.1 insulinase family protein [Enterococcus sp. MMGLQ5-1]NPD13105.1 insulinase family protein [Enterococcus sp. MMGLQ5-1]NPD37721.1 insulinase family protein [Enterococcus sp. MMGLQ5-2]